ncbi:MBL fold metallo-hydrolase [Cellulomonas sp. 179-A 4D5 NHS]|uniref:MBL fold metallo-hydrolase n=1 Tax=Cellulomonas sp. 179-A 4D5 NHS TaxID=3142378 RepID=UPI0039A1F2B1
MTFHRDVADGVHRLDVGHVSCYLLEGAGGGLTLVDAGLPAVWPVLGRALRELGRRPEDLRAVVLTHAHFDHLGVAERLRRRGVTVWGHLHEHELARHPYRYSHERTRASYPFRYPRAVPILGGMVRAGALQVRAVREVRPMPTGTRLPVPGEPEVVFSPGHTWGHCALHVRDRDVLFSGDALVTLDPYTAHTGPRIIAGAATADSGLALRSLDALARTRAGLVLPGHGEPWTGGVRAAAAEARSAGPS